MLVARSILAKGIAKKSFALAVKERSGVSAIRHVSTSTATASVEPWGGKTQTDSADFIVSAKTANDMNRRDRQEGSGAPRHHANAAINHVYGTQKLENGLRAHEKTPLQHRCRRSLPFSPSKALAITADVLLHGTPATPDARRYMRLLAGSRDLRLPVLVAQFIMLRQETKSRTYLSDHLLSKQEMDTRMQSLASRGYTQDDIKAWVWILAGGKGDEMARRFLSYEGPRPLFLLYLLLNKRNGLHVRTKDSLPSLLDYISKKYVLPQVAMQLEPHQRRDNNSSDCKQTMGSVDFTELLEKLVDRTLDLWPALLVNLAHLVAMYVESFPCRDTDRAEHGSEEQNARCLLFNRALQLLERPSPHQPMLTSKHNWAAQKVLLGLANRTEPHLVINRAGYTAIRGVLLRLPKSLEESTVAERYSNTWPPYRKNWDGIDEKRTVEDDISRSVKAGLLMVEAGYHENTHDRSLTALGGGRMGGPPTIQTRAFSPPVWTQKRASWNIYSQWSAAIRATRNAQEAWRSFNSPPLAALKPNIQVYAAMFEKLLAQEVTSARVLPGDTTREVFPSGDVNLSPYEKARLQPPSVKALYDRMRHDNIRPVGSCLAMLIVYADSVGAASQYVTDSPFCEHVPDLLSESLPGESLERLRSMPAPILNAWISLLCRLGGRKHSRDHSNPDGGPQASFNALRVIKLCKVFKSGNYKAPWYSLLGALTGSNFSAMRHNKRMAVFLHAFRNAQAAIGDDPVLVEKLGLFLQKHMHCLTNEGSSASTWRRESTNLAIAHQTLVTMFKRVTIPVSRMKHTRLPPLAHELAPIHLHRYMRALASLGDGAELLGTMRWIMRVWDLESVLEESKLRHHANHAFMASVVSYFFDVGPSLLPQEKMEAVRADAQHLADEKGCSWLWPQPERRPQTEASTDARVGIVWRAFQKEQESLTRGQQIIQHY